MGWQQVVDHGGVELAIAGLLIVFAALSLIALFVVFLPRLTAWLDGIIPPVEHHKALGGPGTESTPADGARARAVAIAAAMHHHRS